MNESGVDREAGLLKLPGDEPMWIWGFTCPEPQCACRTAIVLAAAARDALRSVGEPVADAWVRGVATRGSPTD